MITPLRKSKILTFKTLSIAPVNQTNEASHINLWNNAGNQKIFFTKYF